MQNFVTTRHQSPDITLSGDVSLDELGTLVRSLGHNPSQTEIDDIVNQLNNEGKTFSQPSEPATQHPTNISSLPFHNIAYPFTLSSHMSSVHVVLQTST